MPNIQLGRSIFNTRATAFLLVTTAVLLIAACSPGPSASDESILTTGEDIASEGIDLLQEGEALESDSSQEEPPQEALSAPISGIDPCALLSTSEVEAAFGEPLGNQTRETIFNYESCNFESQSGGKFIILQLTQQNTEQFKRDNEETSAMFEAELIPISGLGNEAAFYSGLLRVRVEETVLQIATWHTDTEQQQALAMTQELAGYALERLP